MIRVLGDTRKEGHKMGNQNYSRYSQNSKYNKNFMKNIEEKNEEVLDQVNIEDVINEEVNEEIFEQTTLYADNEPVMTTGIVTGVEKLYVRSDSTKESNRVFILKP